MSISRSAQISTSRSSVCAAATESELDARDQLGDRKRLDHVVVAAAGETADPIFGAVAGREEDDRHTGAGVSQPLQHFEAVEARHHDIEHDEVGSKGGDGVERGAAIGFSRVS